VNYTYDGANRLAGATDWLGRHTSYSYDPASNLTAINYPNTAGISFSYDRANRLIQVLNNFQGSGEGDDPRPASRFRYTLDAVGNRLRVDQGDDRSTFYSYDRLYELIGVGSGDDHSDQDGAITRYTYDAVGNRLSLTRPGMKVNYSYDAADRLLSAGSATFNYDANGNQIAKTDHGETNAFKYDAANRLLSVTGGDAGTSSFAYDGDGNRISQTVPAGTYQYLNDVATALQVVLQESGPDGNISYAYGLNRISESGTGFDYFYQYDGLGSVAGLTDVSGKLRKRYIYDAWGTTTQTVPARKVGTENKFQFTGEALDPGTGLHYLRARYYDDSNGRFISRDPFMGPTTVPLSLNRYAYSLNNPTRYTDHTGLSPNDSGQTASITSALQNNLTAIWQSLLKDVSAGLPFSSSILSLFSFKVQLLQTQNDINQELPAIAKSAVGFYELGGFTPKQAIDTALATGPGYGTGSLSVEQFKQLEILFNQQLQNSGQPAAPLNSFQ